MIAVDGFCRYQPVQGQKGLSDDTTRFAILVGGHGIVGICLRDNDAASCN